MSYTPVNKRQSGNIFFVILMGLVLFGAVSIAISRGGGNGVQNVRNERAALTAQQIARYGAELKKAVDHIYVNGNVSEADLRFAHPILGANYGDPTSVPTRQVFTEQGGGLAYTAPPPLAFRSAVSTWHFFGTSAIPRVGTDEADLVVVLPDIKEAVCRQINVLQNYAATAPIPVDDDGDGKCVYTATAADRFAGTFKTGGDINLMGTTDFLLPAPEACVSCGGVYHYYKVLLER